MTILDEARLACVSLHGQTKRRFTAEPYSVHPLSVAFMVSGYGEDYEIVALLHDLLEDTPTTEEDLRHRGFAEDIINDVKILTQLKNESNEAYHRRIKRAGSKRAVIVKIADMLHNLQDFYRFGKEEQIRNIIKQILELTM